MPDPAPTIEPRRWYRRPWLWVAVAVVVLWFGSYLLSSRVPPTAPAASGFTALPGAPDKRATAVNVATDDDPSLGPAAAPVVIVEFGDFQCPFCREAAPIIKSLLSRYGEAVRFVYRDFPVSSIHAEALAAAAAANCAAQQGKFWAYHDALFAQQDSLGTSLYLSLARSLGFDTDRWSACTQSAATRAEIEDDFRAGLAAGVRGTPTWFVNGRPVEGALPLDLWVKIVASEVSRKFRR